MDRKASHSISQAVERAFAMAFADPLARVQKEYRFGDIVALRSCMSVLGDELPKAISLLVERKRDTKSIKLLTPTLDYLYAQYPASSSDDTAAAPIERFAHIRSYLRLAVVEVAWVLLVLVSGSRTSGSLNMLPDLAQLFVVLMFLEERIEGTRPALEGIRLACKLTAPKEGRNG